MQPFDSEFIREQRALAEKATPRPWATEWNWDITGADIENRYAVWAETPTIRGPEFQPLADQAQADQAYMTAACNSFPAALAEIAWLAAELARLKAESEWELVRVPDNTDDVLAVDDSGVVFIATYIPETGKWYDNDGELSTKGECPIGWRKLPAAPRSDSNV